MRFLTILLLLLGLITSAQALRVATYNVENYLVCNRMVNGNFKKDYPKPESEKFALRQIIKEVNPDVLAIQEMGDDPMLLELQHDLNSEGLSYEYSTLSQGQDVRHLAILSKIPFSDIQSHDTISIKVDGSPELVRRGLLEVTFNSSDTAWKLFVVHLKSRYSKDNSDPLSEKVRLAEANAIKKLIAQQDTKDFLITGDFNDGPRSKPLKSLTKANFSTHIPGADSNNEIWTYFHKTQGVYSLIDYFLASPSFANKFVNNTAIIYDSTKNAYASDHRLLYIDLDL